MVWEMDSLRAVDLLLVEDDPDDARFVDRLITEHQTALERSGREAAVSINSVEHVDRLSAGIERVGSDSPDVVLLDLALPDSAGLETIDRLVDRAPSVPIVVLTGHNEGELGVDAIRCGAQDYLVKGSITAELLLRTIGYAIERARTQRQLLDRNHRLALLNRLIRTDIRNDLSMVVGWGDQLRSSVDPRDEPALEALLEAATHTLELTDTAAELMDVLAADIDVEREACDLVTVLETELDRLQGEFGDAVTVDRTALPDESVVVSASPTLGSVFAQLLSNAAVHTDRPTASITVALETTADRATVVIADDGVGIPDSQKRLLSDPDARFDADSGMGTGLYLVTTVLDILDGDLEITDNDPRGTAVSVTLDRVRGQ